MRIATYLHGDQVRGGAVVEDRLEGFDLPGPFRLQDHLPNLDALNAVQRLPSVALDSLRLLPPVPDPAKILCVGANYEPHRKEMGRPKPEHPLIFTRFADTLVGHGEPLEMPPVSSHFDYEGELALVIGRTARRLSPEDAPAVVAGYACFNDATVRDWQRHTSQFTPGKNFDRTGAFGPCLVTPDEIEDLGACELQTWVGGECLQQGRISELTFDIPTLLAYLTTFTTLRPGDVVVTGTPAGVGAARKPPRWLRPGETVEVQISGVGVLRNPVVARAPDSASALR